MTKNYFKLMVLAAGLLSATTASAVNLPYAKLPADGKTYILASRLKPTSYLRRTSWDGAFYLQSYDLNEQKKAAFTAKLNDDGTWNFYQEVTETNDGEEPTTYNVYMGIPAGTDNLNINAQEPVSWTLEPTDLNDYYLLKAGAGQGNELTVGGYLHLNNGGEYLVITESTNGWFPDFYGGIQRDENEEPVYDETGFVVPQNTISRYWAFIELSDVPAYTLKVQLYAELQDIEERIQADETFKAGFQSALDAAMVYYGKDDFTEADLTAAKAILDAKKNLYNEIEQAQTVLAETPSAQLEAAIASAIDTFNTKTDAESLAAAVAALKEAEANAVLGGDDMTLLGTNMSFEDLSAQNGSTTTGVAAAPTGWNVYVNGQQVKTADEVRAAGITAWHGVNTDAEGALDGSYAFGIWTSVVPEYEISQTISGLENGSYTISAAVMVGANGSGSRRTTQRIFGNMNSKYFANDYDYNTELLNQEEIYTFEGLEEPVTDRELQPMTVRAFVWDGTLTFGLRTNGNFAAAGRETGNGAGGDGWFKLDNFHITKEGFIKNDALAVYQHYADLYGKLRGLGMQNTAKEELAKILKVEVDANSTQQEIIEAITAQKEAYPLIKASADLYAGLREAIRNGEMYYETYEHSASAEEFLYILGDAEDLYQEGSAGEEEINAMIASIAAGIENLKATAVAVGNITFVLKNPSFEDLSNQGGSPSNSSVAPPAGWTLKVNGEEVTEAPAFGWCAINHGDNIDVTDDEGVHHDHQYTDGEYLWGIWNSDIPEIEMSQTLYNMPVGNYTVKADVMVEFNWAGNCLTTQRLFGNDCVQMFGADYYHEVNLPEDAKNARVLTYAGYTCFDEPTTSLLRPMEVNFDVSESGILRIGFRTNSLSEQGEPQGSGKGWFKLDNFRLIYNSEQVSVGITSMPASRDANSEVYGLDGKRRSQPQRGINIVRYGDKTVKMIVK